MWNRGGRSRNRSTKVEDDGDGDGDGDSPSKIGNPRMQALDYVVSRDSIPGLNIEAAPNRKLRFFACSLVRFGVCLPRQHIREGRAPDLARSAHCYSQRPSLPYSSLAFLALIPTSILALALILTLTPPHPHVHTPPHYYHHHYIHHHHVGQPASLPKPCDSRNPQCAPHLLPPPWLRL